MTEVPEEIYGLIVNEVVKSSENWRLRVSALHKCSRISNKFWKHSRRHLFREIGLLFNDGSPPLSRLIDLMLDATYSITPLIQSLNLGSGYYPRSQREQERALKPMCRFFELLVKCGRLEELVLREWDFIKGTLRSILYTVFAIPSLRKVEVSLVGGLPRDIFKNTHITSLKLRAFMEKTKMKPLASPINGPPLTSLDTDNSFPFLDLYYPDDESTGSRQMSISSLVSSKATAALLTKTLEVALKSSQSLKKLELRLQNGFEEATPYFDFSTLDKLSHLTVRFGRGNFHGGESSDISIFCDKMLRPSLPITSITTLHVRNEVWVSDRGAVDEFEADTKEQWESLDRALSHPGWASLRTFKLDVAYSFMIMTSRVLPGADALVCNSAEKLLRSYFPLLTASESIKFSLNITVASGI